MARELSELVIPCTDCGVDWLLCDCTKGAPSEPTAIPCTHCDEDWLFCDCTEKAPLPWQYSQPKNSTPTAVTEQALGTFSMRFFMANGKRQTSRYHVTTVLRSRLQFAVHV